MNMEEENDYLIAMEPETSETIQGPHPDSCYYLILHRAMRSLLDNDLIAIHPSDKVEDLLPFWTGTVLALLKENDNEADNMVQTLFLKYSNHMDPTVLDTIFTVIDTVADGETWETRWAKLSDAMRERFKATETVIDTICVVDAPRELTMQQQETGGEGDGDD